MLTGMKKLEANDPRSLQDGRYELLGILGEGSMGRTYLAEDAESGRVAIKALYPSRLATMKDLELFHREADILQRLDHPRIPSYVDAFDEGEGEAVRYFLVQEYVDGKTLRELVAEGARWSESDAVDLLRRLLTVVDHMHTRDPVVVHRDIKPDNIIIRAQDEMPALVDFGAVREIVRLTMGGGSTIIGTYGYMPPEQLMGRAVPASDLYAIGVTILELLTRQTPKDLHGEDVARLIESANITESFRRVLGRMCAPALSDRYAEADQVIGDLEAVSGGGALVHAGRIEGDIEQRNREREKALKKSSTPNFVHLGYLFLVTCLVGAVVFAAGMLIYTVVTGFEAAFLVTALLSGSGMLGALLLLGTRYKHDAWEPPDSRWTHARGRIDRTSERHAVDAYGAIIQDRVIGYTLHYSFASRAGRYEGALPLPPEANVERYPEGMEFDVYYHSGKPEWHEIQDFPFDPDDAMGRLFDPTVKHTPE